MFTYPDEEILVADIPIIPVVNNLDLNMWAEVEGHSTAQAGEAECSWMLANRQGPACR